MGQNGRWRRAMVDQIAASPAGRRPLRRRPPPRRPLRQQATLTGGAPAYFTGGYSTGGLLHRRLLHRRLTSPAGGPLVLDVASGTAGVAAPARRSRTGARVVGVDLTEAMLRQGQANVARPGPGQPDRPGRRAGRSGCRSPTPASTR